MSDSSTHSTPMADQDGQFAVTPQDAGLFEKFLRSFVPENSFDAHAHWLDPDHSRVELPEAFRKLPAQSGWSVYREQVGKWMGDRTPAAGLFFAFPKENGDYRAGNQFVADQMQLNDDLRGLVFVTPDDDPDQVEQLIQTHGFSGIKVYSWHATGPDGYRAEIGEFLPEWVWEIADKRNLAIMLHIVKDRAIADPANQRYITEHCGRYRSANLVLAHCARCFNSGHALEGIADLRGYDNIFFDNSAICEPGPSEEIIKVFGPTRLRFGMDFPICQLRGRASSVGDGFHWVDEKNTDWSADFGDHHIFGFENIYALQQACRHTHLTDDDVEQIFFGTAHQLYQVGTPTTGTGQALYREAKKIIPVGTQLLSKLPEWWLPEQWPAYYREGRGCITVDMDGRHLLDFSSMGIGACLLGFADPDVTAAVVRRIQFGSMTTMMVPEEVELARVLIDIHPWAEKVRFARTGGGSMSVAVRIARSVTGREKVALCGYHGWHDWYVAANLDGEHQLDDHLLPGLVPHGVPARLAKSIYPFQYNDIDQLERIFADNPGEIAAVTMEAIRHVTPEPGYLQAVRDLCTRHGAQLIFDEVSIGWRYTLGGSHLRLGVNPDIAVFAKSISNGHPMGAIIGTEQAMRGADASFISSAYWTEAAGPVAALAAIEKMRQVDAVSHVEQVGTRLQQIWREGAEQHGLSIQLHGIPCHPGFTFQVDDPLPVTTLFTAEMLRLGVMAKPDVFPSYAHKSHHLEAYASALDATFSVIATGLQNGDIEKRIGGPVCRPGFKRRTTSATK